MAPTATYNGESLESLLSLDLFESVSDSAVESGASLNNYICVSMKAAYSSSPHFEISACSCLRATALSFLRQKLGVANPRVQGIFSLGQGNVYLPAFCT